jgi:hypothetical protein
VCVCEQVLYVCVYVCVKLSEATSTFESAREQVLYVCVYALGGAHVCILE